MEWKMIFLLLPIIYYFILLPQSQTGIRFIGIFGEIYVQNKKRERNRSVKCLVFLFLDKFSIQYCTVYNTFHICKMHNNSIFFFLSIILINLLFASFLLCFSFFVYLSISVKFIIIPHKIQKKQK